MSENPWIPLLELTGTFKVEDLPEFSIEELIARADRAQSDGEKELNYGRTISQILDDDDESKESQTSLATIGIWHFECAVELFEKAVRNYERAKTRGLSKDQLKEVEPKIKECHRQILGILGQKKTAGESLKE
jgi:hypothetical protein